MQTRSSRSALSLLLGAVLALVIGGVGVLAASPVQAHDQLIGSNPKQGATLDKQPPWIELEFSGNIQDIGNEIQVKHDDKDVSAGELTVDGTKVKSALPDDLEPGAYTVVWRVVSSDGHPISGTVDFTLADSNAAGGDATPNSIGSEPLPSSGSVDAVPADSNSDPQANADQQNTSGTANSISPVLMIVIAVGGLAVVVLVIALFVRKSRGLGN